VRRWRLVLRRDAHQTRNREPIAVTAGGQKRVRILWNDPGLLRLGAGIDLREQQGAAALPGDLLGERLARLARSSE